MRIRRIFKGFDASEFDLKYSFDRTGKGRPAWIRVDNIPKGINFISILLGKKGYKGRNVVAYSTYLMEGLFLPVDYTREEMSKFYDEFSKDYNKLMSQLGWNLKAVNLLAKETKKYLKKGQMLDLGAGTGQTTEIFLKQGYYPATLVDYSKGMLEKAKKRESLKGCKFVNKSMLTLDLGREYDLIVSIFSLGSSNYFNDKEQNQLIEVINKHLKKDGVIAVLGHQGNDFFEGKFKKLSAGIYTLSKEKGFYAQYFIGRKL